MDTQTTITLLTIAVVLLSAVMVVILAIVIGLLVKLRRITKNVDAIIDNIAQATQWVTPAKVLSQLFKLIRK